MANFSHAPFRELIADLGGCDIFFTEMLNSRVIVTQRLKDDPYLIRARNDKPIFAQVAGSDPNKIAEAIKYIEGMFDGININMGCSRGIIQRFGWGVSLMSDINLAALIIKKARKATMLELTVKLRSGLYEHNISYLKKFCIMLENEGVDAIILHPRTGKERFSKKAQWEEIAEIKTVLSLPIIGNGDIFCPEDAKKMLDYTNCDGIMIGRAALIRPWIIRDIKAYLKGEYISCPDPLSIIQKFHENLILYSPANIINKRFIDFCFWFFQNWPFALHWYKKITQASNPFEQAKTILSMRPSIRSYPVLPFMIK